MTLETTPSFHLWPAKYKALAILLSQGYSKSQSARELGSNLRWLRKITNHGCKHFTPDEFQAAVIELSQKIGAASMAGWLGLAQETFREMRADGKLPSPDKILEFATGLLKEGGPSATMKSEISIRGGSFSDELIDAYSSELRKRMIDARYDASEGSGPETGD